MKSKKQIKNRIGVVLCALVVLVGCFGISTNYYAMESEDFVMDSELDYTNEFAVSVLTVDVRTGYDIQYAYNLKSYGPLLCVIGREYQENYTYKGNTYSNVYMGRIYFYSTKPIYTDYSSHSSRIALDNGEYLYCISMHLGNPQNVGWAVVSNESEDNIVFNGYFEQSPHNKHLPLLAIENGLVDFDNMGGGSVKYDYELGYLQDVVSKTTFLENDFGVEDMNSGTRHLYFSNITTSGLDLLSGNYSINLYGQVCYYDGYTDIVYNDNYPLLLFANYTVDDSLKLSYNAQLMLKFLNENTDIQENAWDILTKTLIRSDNVYLQIKDNDSGKVGGYVKIAFRNNGDTETHYIKTVDENLEDDIDNGYSEKELPNEVGSGQTEDDALEDAKPTGVHAISGLDALSSNLSSLSSSIGNVPKLIGDLFSMLPPWCSALFGIGFCLSLVVMIVKIARG